MNKILFGGAFDPVHNGHINMALNAAKALDGEIIFLPAPISVWKKSSAPISDKIAMLEMAIKGKEKLSIDLFEVNSGEETNYSIDTVKHFKELYPSDKLFYLIGFDQVNEFHRWKEAELLSSLAQIVYYNRPGYVVNKENVEKYHMLAINGPVVDVSSTEIRELKSLDLPDEVLFYIVEHNLYEGMVELNQLESPHRLNHSKSVAKVAYEIAKANNLENPLNVFLAALLHDCGKDIPLEKQIELTKKHFPEYQDCPKFAYHQFAGAALAMERFKVTNKDMIEAIEFHSTGSGNMNPIAKIVYAADKIEPTRGFDSSDLIKAMMDDVDLGFKTVLQANKDFLLSKGKTIDNQLTSNCFKKYL